MSSTESSLPTAWLAPPEGLLRSEHPIQIAPAPLAISVTLALIVGAFIIILLMQKSILVFLEDRIISTKNAGDCPPVTEKLRHRTDANGNTAVLRAAYPLAANGKHVARREAFGLGPKSDDLLGGEAYPPRASFSRNIESRQRVQTPSPFPEYDSDAETLNDFERNSAYWPLARSDVNDTVQEVKPQGPQRAEHAHLYDNSSMLPSSLGLASRKNLGDAY